MKEYNLNAKKYKLSARLLYKFLMKERVLHLYIEEVLKQNYQQSAAKVYKTNKDVLALLNFYDDINFSLHWASTLQGHYFWEDLNSKFRHECSKLLLWKKLMNTTP